MVHKIAASSGSGIERRGRGGLSAAEDGNCPRRVSQSGPSTVRPGWLFSPLLGRPPTGSDQLHQRVERRQSAIPPQQLRTM